MNLNILILLLKFLQFFLIDCIEWEPENWARRCDFTTSVLTTSQVKAEECGGLCSMTQGCTHFTWTRYYGGTCWMRQGFVSRSDAIESNDDGICGIIISSPAPTFNQPPPPPSSDATLAKNEVNINGINWQEGNWARKCDFRGNDLQSSSTRAEYCSGLCTRTEGCTHFSWTKSGGGTCWMKKGLVSKKDASLTNEESMLCGIVISIPETTTPSTTTTTTKSRITANTKSTKASKTQKQKENKKETIVNGITWQPGNWAKRCDFRGNDLKNVQIRSEECGDACSKTTDCTHYVWSQYVGGTCWMKKGTVSINDAFQTNDDSMLCGVIIEVPEETEPPEIEEPINNNATFRVINRCLFTVWPAIQGARRSDPYWKLPFNGGWELAPGASSKFDLPFDFFAGRIWGRTNCKIISGRFQCETGDCGRKECADGGIPRSGQTPITIAEFTLNSDDKDYYNINVAEGYNIQMTIKIKNQTKPINNNNYNWCQNPTCVRDLNKICPYELAKRSNFNGAVIGCSSACEIFRTEKYCCRNSLGKIETCKKTGYSQLFKQVCPSAYSPAANDQIFNCKNTDYEIIFC